MALEVTSGEEITLTEAQEYISEFEKQYPNEVKAFFIGANHFTSILNQEDCIGIRIYNGYDLTEERMSQVLVGVDTDENDMKGGIIVNKSLVCPPVCPTISIMD